MTNYSEKFISYTDDGVEIDSLTLEAGDSHIVQAHVKEYNLASGEFEYTIPSNIYGVLEKFEDNDFVTVAQADVYGISNGIYKVVFTAPYEPGIFYLKITVQKDGYIDVNRLKVRVKVDVK
jgi:hypothetical protein